MTIAELQANPDNGIMYIVRYLRRELPDKDDDFYQVDSDIYKICSESALAYMCKVTGRSPEYIKAQHDLTYPYLALTNEEYLSRQYRLQVGQYRNDFLMDVLLAHSVNLLPGEADLVGDDNA